jgi:hypothetical protein
MTDKQALAMKDKQALAMTQRQTLAMTPRSCHCGSLHAGFQHATLNALGDEAVSTLAQSGIAAACLRTPRALAMTQRQTLAMTDKQALAVTLPASCFQTEERQPL